MEQLKYPIGIQNFEKIRKEHFVYVDKTALVYKLASEGCYYTLTRPRRFGKSLLISTLEAYFNGQRELFQGLAIEQLEKEWTIHPVLHLDLNIQKYDPLENMVIKTNDYIYIIEFKLDGSPQQALRQIEEKGYDKPFALDKRRLYRIGVNFSLNKRCIDGWEIA